MYFTPVKKPTLKTLWTFTQQTNIEFRLKQYFTNLEENYSFISKKQIEYRKHSFQYPFIQTFITTHIQLCLKLELQNIGTKMYLIYCFEINFNQCRINLYCRITKGWFTLRWILLTNPNVPEQIKPPLSTERTIEPSTRSWISPKRRHLSLTQTTKRKIRRKVK